MSIIAEIEAAVPALHRYARSLVEHRADADDLVQDCLVRALSGLPKGQGGLSVRPWLFTILHNLSANRWRALRRRGTAVALGRDDGAEPGLSVAPAQEWAATTRDLLRGFESLSAEHRQVLLLVSIEGLAYRDAAAVLEVPVGTVMSRLSRARDALRAHMAGAERPLLRRVK